MNTKRLLTLILTLILTLTPLSAVAPNGFTDVPVDSWYYQSVRTVSESGLMNGKGNGIFDPDGQLTNAEVFALAARLKTMGKSSFKPSEPWYQVYADYVNKNIRDISGYEPTATATRLGFARILAKALPESALPEINRVDDGAIPDIKDIPEVYLLYRAGILTGSDSSGSFLPDSGIKRSEAAAIIARMADKTLRKSITLTNSLRVGFDVADRSSEETKLIVDSYIVTDFPSWYAGKYSITTDPEHGTIYRYEADGNSMLFSRTLKLEPDTVYKVTIEAKTENARGASEHKHGGAFLRAGDFNESKLLSGTNDWTKLTVVETTGSDGMLKLAVGFGFYDDKCSGKVWFTDATIEPADDYKGYENSFDASEWGDPKHINTSLYEENNLDFSINGSRLTVSGQLEYEDLDSLWVRCGESEKIFDARSGEYFKETLSIPGDCEVTIYAKRSGESLYWSYIYDVLFIENNSLVHSPVLEHNLSELSKPRNPSAYLSYSLSDEIIARSNEIVGNATDDYEKLLRIHDWVADNIYYDYDYYYGKSETLYWSPEEVLRERRTVCAGYAKLTEALVQAQGIPCMVVSTFATGVSTSGGFANSSNAAATSTNHAHIEAYIDGRWVTVDPTWDSGNTYENGKFEYKPFKRTYFDMTPDFFAFTHKIIGR